MTVVNKRMRFFCAVILSPPIYFSFQCFPLSQVSRFWFIYNFYPQNDLNALNGCCNRHRVRDNRYVLGGVPSTAGAEDAFVRAIRVPTTITLVSGRVQKYTSSRRYCQISSSFSAGAGRRKNAWRFPVFPKIWDVFKNTRDRSHRVHYVCVHTLQPVTVTEFH